MCIVSAVNVSASTSAGWRIDLLPHCLCPDGYEPTRSSNACVPMSFDAYALAVRSCFRSLYYLTAFALLL